MSYWRKLLVVMLLALSLPVQSFAAVSMICEPSHFGGDGATAQHADWEESAHHHQMHDAMTADGDHYSHHTGDAQHVHTCSTCASCCFGGGLPLAATVATSANAVHFAVPVPPSARVPSFLTDGVERPPRISLV
nr:hypothetical protein [Paraburkholderia ultramafica]